MKYRFAEMISKWLFLFTLVFVNQTLANRGMVPIEPSWTEKPGTLIEVTNMPRVIQQGGLGICAAATASVLIDHSTCKSKGISNCSDMGDENRTSIIDLLRYSPPDSDELDSSEKWAKAAYRSEFTGLNIKTGHLAGILYKALPYGGGVNLLKESCAPFARIQSGLDDRLAAVEADVKKWQSIEDSYKEFQLKGCIDCAESYADEMGKNLVADFNLTFSLVELPEALIQPTFEEFLNIMLIPLKCEVDMMERLAYDRNLTFDHFPHTEGDYSYGEFMDFIKQKLTRQIPLGFAFCASVEVAPGGIQACKKEGHALVIKAYKEVCDSSGICKEALQVQNSWGQGWQDENANGWLDARTLVDRSFYRPSSFSWVEFRND